MTNGRGRPLLPIGVTDYDFEPKHVGLPVDLMFQHALIAGASGCGKSTLLITIGLAWLALGYGLIFFDPKGDECLAMLKRIPHDQRHRVRYLNVKHTSLTLNVLDNSQRVFSDPYHLTSQLSSIIDEVSQRRGEKQSPRQYRFLNMALYSVMQGMLKMSGLPPCLADVKRFMIDKRFRDKLLATLVTAFPNDARVRGICHEMKDIDRDVSFAALINKLHPLVEEPVLSRLFSARETTLDLENIVRDERGAIVLIDLSDLPVGTLQLAGSILLSYFFNASLLRPKTKRIPLLYLLDEFYLYASEACREITRVRSYNVSLVFSHQSVASVKTDIMNTILDNCAFTIGMRCGGNYAPLLARQYGEWVTASDLVTLPNYMAWVKTPTKVFSCQTLPPAPEAEMPDAIPLPRPTMEEPLTSPSVSDSTDQATESPIKFSLAIEIGSIAYQLRRVL